MRGTRAKRLRRTVKMMFPTLPNVEYVVKKHQTQFELAGEKYTMTREQLKLADHCKRKVYQDMK